MTLNWVFEWLIAGGSSLHLGHSYICSVSHSNNQHRVVCWLVLSCVGCGFIIFAHRGRLFFLHLVSPHSSFTLWMCGLYSHSNSSSPSIQDTQLVQSQHSCMGSFPASQSARLSLSSCMPRTVDLCAAWELANRLVHSMWSIPLLTLWKKHLKSITATVQYICCSTSQAVALVAASISILKLQVVISYAPAFPSSVFPLSPNYFFVLWWWSHW